MLINVIVISNGTAEDYSENIEEAIKNGQPRETGNIFSLRPEFHVVMFIMISV
jgi:hypothetical protein